ncbi:MAG TPA: DUF507 family protein [Thermoanaerobaculia bacterium]|nr:DUF507 family protein [Thermoanaerobaculia bacterium]
MKVSADRILYLSRVILKSLKENRNLEQKSDDETARRAVVRELTDSYNELDALEEKVRASLARRKNLSETEREFQFTRQLDDELRKHGA